MADRPHSRKVKIQEGVAEVKKGEKVESTQRASERKSPADKNDAKKQ